MEDHGNYVEICGERFPACNIQIWSCYPSPLYIGTPEEGYWSGLYFEMMFETGFNLAITQEIAGVMNHLVDGLHPNCSDYKDALEHFIVEITHVDDNHDKVIFSHHVVGEGSLAAVLKFEMNHLSDPTIISGVRAMV